jgi:23S rRNA pseudouridine1911/1915/1917 synthase
MRRRVQLPPDAAGRLDRALADALGLGRAAVKRAFALGEVRAGGRRVRASDPAAPGLWIDVEVEDAAGPPAPEPSAPLRVLVETPRALIVEKPAGVAVYALAPGEGGTLANAVAARYPECASASPAPREGGAVHRLDIETSGCVAFARDREAWDLLHAQLRGREAEKRYLALAVGRVASGGVCSVPLAQRGGRVVPAPDALSEDRLQAKGFKARPAETHFEVARRFRDHTLLDVRLVTGVMHQIRAHLAHLGHPVAGDALYGGAAAALPGLGRQFLHAARLRLAAPGGGTLEAESPLPDELQAVLAALPPVP